MAICNSKAFSFNSNISTLFIQPQFSIRPGPHDDFHGWFLPESVHLRLSMPIKALIDQLQVILVMNLCKNCAHFQPAEAI